MASIYDNGLDRNTANHQPLTPLTLLERAAATFPEHTAIVHGRQRVSYREFWQRSLQLASALAASGIGKGDTVLYHAAFGDRALQPSSEPMTEDTIFDVASLTKVVATTTSMLTAVAIAAEPPMVLRFRTAPLRSRLYGLPGLTSRCICRVG